MENDKKLKTAIFLSIKFDKMAFVEPHHTLGKSCILMIKKKKLFN